MRNILKLFSISICLAFIVTACAPAVAPITPEVIKETVVVKETVIVKETVEVPETVLVPETVVSEEPVTNPPFALPLEAVKVAEMPAIDGNASDPAWKDAPTLKVGVLTMKAVYDTDNIAFLMVWQDRDLSINSRGTWNWDSATQTWSQTGMAPGTWESFKGNRHQEWVNVAFDISSVVGSEGCFAFCHEYPVGSGIFHHNTAGPGQYVDSWGLLGKHGYGSLFIQDMGWTLGYLGVTQNGEVSFDPTNTMDPISVINGDVTFIGHSEDKIIAPIGDPNYPTTTRPADLYCIDCHEKKGVIDYTETGNTTFGDDGELPYFANWNDDFSSPIYMEISPADFADSMVLTQLEIDSGEAVLVADLTSAQINAYWANYSAVNGVVPHLVLQEPTGSNADVLTAANWKNGVWTAEFTRSLVNGNFDDVQFDDITKEYSFGISLWNHTDLLAPLMRFVPGTLTFKY